MPCVIIRRFERLTTTSFFRPQTVGFPAKISPYTHASVSHTSHVLEVLMSLRSRFMPLPVVLLISFAFFTPFAKADSLSIVYTSPQNQTAVVSPGFTSVAFTKVRGERHRCANHVSIVLCARPAFVFLCGQPDPGNRFSGDLTRGRPEHGHIRPSYS